MARACNQGAWSIRTVNYIIAYHTIRDGGDIEKNNQVAKQSSVTIQEFFSCASCNCSPIQTL
jgi:hypothetical protein